MHMKRFKGDWGQLPEKNTRLGILYYIESLAIMFS